MVATFGFLARDKVKKNGSSVCGILSASIFLFLKVKGKEFLFEGDRL